MHFFSVFMSVIEEKPVNLHVFCGQTAHKPQ